MAQDTTMDATMEEVKPIPDSTQLSFEFSIPEISQEVTEDATTAEESASAHDEGNHSDVSDDKEATVDNNDDINMELPITSAFTPVNKGSTTSSGRTVNSPKAEAAHPLEGNTTDEEVSKSSEGKTSESTEVEVDVKPPKLKAGKSSEGKAANIKATRSSGAKSSKAATKTTATKTPARKGPVATNEKPALLESAASKLKRTFSSANLESITTRDKDKLSDVHSGPNGKSARPSAELDPENYEVKRLREEEGLKWGEIADIMNKQRVKAGRMPTLTENAVYSRYMRNAPRIAAANGEQDWSPKQIGPRLVGSNVKAHAPLPAFTPEQDELLVKSYKETVDETWQRVAKKMKAKGAGNELDPDDLARRYRML